MTLATIAREFRELPVGRIDAPALPSRAQMDEVGLDELTASIRAIGLQLPLIVARRGDRYEVVAGHRRLLACQRIGLAVVPCLVYASADAALEAVKYAENRHREELSAADEAIWFAELLERNCGGDVDLLCVLIGERRVYVEGRLLLLHGDEAVFRALQDGKIRIGVAQQLNRCSEEQTRRYFLHQAILGGATVAVVSSWIADWQNTRVLAAGQPATPPVVSAPPPIPETDFFRCVCCGGTDNVHLMRPINVHDYCRLAILDKLLAAYRGVEPESSVATDPRR